MSRELLKPAMEQPGVRGRRRSPVVLGSELRARGQSGPSLDTVVLKPSFVGGVRGAKRVHHGPGTAFWPPACDVFALSTQPASPAVCWPRSCDAVRTDPEAGRPGPAEGFSFRSEGCASARDVDAATSSALEQLGLNMSHSMPHPRPPVVLPLSFLCLFLLPTDRTPSVRGLADVAPAGARGRCAMTPVQCRKALLVAFLIKESLFTGHVGPGRSEALFEVEHCRCPRVRCCCWVSRRVPPSVLGPFTAQGWCSACRVD